MELNVKYRGLVATTEKVALIKKLRSSSERINSALKEDLKILDKPRVLNRHRSNILAQMSGIVLLLKRAFFYCEGHHVNE